MKQNRFLYIILIAIICAFIYSACIDELNIDTEEEQIILIVEGFIDTDPGPHTITVSRTAKYGSIFEGFVSKQEDATLRIRDDEGGQVVLSEVDKGIYQTPSTFAAKVGNSYTLIIELLNGAQYISKPEKVIAAPEIKKLIPVFQESPGIDEFSFNSGIDLFAQWDDPEENNYYFWKTSGIYLIYTHPELFVARDGSGTPFPAPKDCCSKCFVYEQHSEKQFRIFSDDLSTTGEINEKVAYIQDDGGRFQDKYMAAVAQYSLTREAYRFFSLINNQLSIDGDIFDPPPATVRGNMINLSDPDANVIGYFAASDVQRDTIYLTSDLIGKPQPARVINDDCRVLTGSTTSQPPFWE